MYTARASYSPFRPGMEEKTFRTFLGAWWWGKRWTWRHPFALVLIEKRTF
jgi:hypothetical protein